MQGYQITAILLRFLVDALLLVGASRLCGYPNGFLRCILGALIGALHTALCLIPEFYFLGNPFWRWVLTGVSCLVAYGMDKTSFRCAAVYLLLHMAVNGALGGRRNLLGAVLAGMGVFALCVFGFSWKGLRQYVPVQLSYGGKELNFTALMDTGNTLYDPVSGQNVLVMGADAA